MAEDQTSEGHVVDVSEVIRIKPPCFDPTCVCCNAWSALGELVAEEVERLKAVIQTYSDTYEN